MSHDKTILSQQNLDTKRFKRIKKFRNYHPLKNLSPRCLFSEAAVHRCFLKYMCSSKFSNIHKKTPVLEPLLIKFQVFFYRTPTVTVSGFLKEEILFFSRIWYLLLTITPVFVPNSFQEKELNLKSSCWSCSVKKVFLDIWQVSQENTCAEVSF